MGLYQIAKAVSFLNNECSLVRHCQQLNFGTELILVSLLGDLLGLIGSFCVLQMCRCPKFLPP